jgi:hypothetical protein
MMDNLVDLLEQARDFNIRTVAVQPVRRADIKRCVT